MNCTCGAALRPQRATSRQRCVCPCAELLRQKSTCRLQDTARRSQNPVSTAPPAHLWDHPPSLHGNEPPTPVSRTATFVSRSRKSECRPLRLTNSAWRVRRHGTARSLTSSLCGSPCRLNAIPTAHGPRPTAHPIRAKGNRLPAYPGRARCSQNSASTAQPTLPMGAPTTYFPSTSFVPKGSAESADFGAARRSLELCLDGTI